jgi:hypothetical protein
VLSLFLYFCTYGTREDRDQGQSSPDDKRGEKCGSLCHLACLLCGMSLVFGYNGEGNNDVKESGVWEHILIHSGRGRSVIRVPSKAMEQYIFVK